MVKVLLVGNINEIVFETLKKKGFEVDQRPLMSEEELILVIDTYDSLVVRSATKVTRRVLEAAKNLKLVVKAGVGVDNIDLIAAKDLGIVVENSPDSICNAVVEFVFGQMHLLSKKVLDSHRKTKIGVWDKKNQKGRELRGKVLGIVGFGRIGKNVSKIALAMGMNVLAYDPYVDDQIIKNLGVMKVTLDQLFAMSDYITLHVPLMEETKNLLNEEAFSKMKDGVKIINTARGGIINEAALHQALLSGKVGAAAIDTWEIEPVDSNNVLFQHEHVIASSHIAGSTYESQENVAMDVVEQIVQAFKHNYLMNVVNGVEKLRSGNVLDRAIILAAGIGAGLKPLTNEVPKCLTEINGVPVLERCLKILNKKGIIEAIIVIGYLGEEVKRYFGSSYKNIKLTYIESKDYATTGSVYSAWLVRAYLDKPCLFIESDTIFEESIIDELLEKDPTYSYWAADKFSEKFVGCRLTVEGEKVKNLEVIKSKMVSSDHDIFFKSIGVIRMSGDFAQSFSLWLDEYVKITKRGYFGHAITPYLREKDLKILNVAGKKWFEIDTYEDIREAERQFQPMRYVMLVVDGAADVPIESLGSKTIFEAAHTPNLDYITLKGKTGLVKTMFPELPVGSIVANMSFLGFNPGRYYPFGRASFEAIAQSIYLGERDVVFRCNLISIEDGKIKDFTSSQIPDDHAFKLINSLKIEDSELEIYAGQSYRNLLVVRNAPFSAKDIIAAEPHNNHGTIIREILLKTNKEKDRAFMDKLNNFMLDSVEQIKKLNEVHQTNADMLWLWSPSTTPKMPSFFSKFGMHGAVVGGLDFIRGIAKCARMETVKVPGATGEYGTNLKEKFKYAKNFLRTNEFLFLHYNATDEEGHAKNPKKKKEALEMYDHELLGPLLYHLQKEYADNFRIFLMPDHYTLSTTGVHTDDPVPYVMYGKDVEMDEITAFSERLIVNKPIVKGYEIMDFFVSNKD